MPWPRHCRQPGSQAAVALAWACMPALLSCRPFETVCCLLLRQSDCLSLQHWPAVVNLVRDEPTSCANGRGSATLCYHPAQQVAVWHLDRKGRHKRESCAPCNVSTCAVPDAIQHLSLLISRQVCIVSTCLTGSNLLYGVLEARHGPGRPHMDVPPFGRVR